MRQSVALLLGVLVSLLGFAGVGQAQSSMQVQGTIEDVDCQAQTVTVSGPDGSNTIALAPYTTVLVDSVSTPPCDLARYVGAPVSMWLVADGDAFAATRIDVASQPVAAPAPPPATPEVASPLPLVGIVLGTIVVAGLLYLLVNDNGAYYRYPYYGSYYGYYYRPFYRPYLGPYPALAPVISVAVPIAGAVLGVIVGADRLPYLLARDSDGHFSRYPYYGPYQRYYARPGYRPYAGAYGNAPVRQGDPRWDGPAYAGGRNLTPAGSGPAQSRPNYQPTQPRPTYQPTPTYGAPNLPRPNYQPTQPRPTYQPTPTYRGPDQSRPSYQRAPSYQGGRGGNSQGCGNQRSDQSCSNGGGRGR